MQLLPHEMQELLRIGITGLRSAFILLADSALIQREESVRHVL